MIISRAQGTRALQARLPISPPLIIFLDDSRYERIDPDTGAKEIRTRKSGDVIWHNKGEVAPVLTNMNKKTYQTLVIELK